MGISSAERYGVPVPLFGYLPNGVIRAFYKFRNRSFPPLVGTCFRNRVCHFLCSPLKIVQFSLEIVRISHFGSFTTQNPHFSYPLWRPVAPRCGGCGRKTGYVDLSTHHEVSNFCDGEVTRPLPHVGSAGQRAGHPVSSDFCMGHK